MTQHAILPSRNEDFGFFGTLTVCPQRDRRSADVWTLASGNLRGDGQNVADDYVCTGLDQRHGSRLAFDVYWLSTTPVARHWRAYACCCD